MVYPSGYKFSIPCAEELDMLLRMFGWFVAHHMGNVVSDAENQGGVCPLEETVGDGNVRLGIACGFQKVRLVWDANALVDYRVDRGVVFSCQADFPAKSDSSVP